MKLFGATEPLFRCPVPSRRLLFTIGRHIESVKAGKFFLDVRPCQTTGIFFALPGIAVEVQRSLSCPFFLAGELSCFIHEDYYLPAEAWVANFEMGNIRVSPVLILRDADKGCGAPLKRFVFGNDHNTIRAQQVLASIALIDRFCHCSLIPGTLFSSRLCDRASRSQAGRSPAGAGCRASRSVYMRSNSSCSKRRNSFNSSESWSPSPCCSRRLAVLVAKLCQPHLWK